MSKWSVMIAAIAIAGVIGFLTVAPPPEPRGEPLAQLAAGPPPRPVENDELELYISVYKAMQSNRDLKIDAAVQPHNLTLEEFRDIERRVQMRTTLVDRVRRELLAHAEQSSIFGAVPTASPAAP